jgi:phospholipid/cholesterol/gamma-HCH transport system permease protein
MIHAVADQALAVVAEVGRFSLFGWALVVESWFFVRQRLRGFKLDDRLIMEQFEAIGAKSVPVVLITALFTGMVLALQASISLEEKLKGVSQFMGRTVALPFIRELGPVLTALIVTGRIGSSIAAELGTMKVTEQMDALRTLGTRPMRYLGVPRLVACLVMLPMLTMMAAVVGIVGGFLVSYFMLDLSAIQYFGDIPQMLGLADLWSGLGKTFFFGGIIALVSCYKGFGTSGGAEGVGRATTESVVWASMMILISDYFLTAFFALFF